MALSFILSGFYSAGKTTIGKLLSEKWNKEFIDTDDLLQKNVHMVPRKFWQEYGEAAFRQKESEVIQSLEKKSAIIAIGGGALLLPQNQIKLKSLGKMIYLKASCETLLSRMEKKGVPIFFENLENFREKALSRFHLYEKASDEIIETDHMNESEIINVICEKYGKQ